MKEPALTEARIAEVVDQFYARVREDALLGPVFNGAIADWPHHLDKLKAFWSSMMLASGRYKGNPMAAHLPHAPALTEQAFARWLSLWHTTTAELLPPETAAAMQDKAKRIAQSLSLAMAFQAKGDGGRLDRMARAARVGMS